jgi:periplasmic protein TonB
MTVSRSSTFSPVSTSTRWLFAPAQHALLIGVTISLLLHAGVLFWHASSATRVGPMLSELEIVLVNARTDLAPLDPQVQAQNQVDGGVNDTKRGMVTNPLPQTHVSANTIVLQAMRKRRLELEAEQQRLLTQIRDQAKTGQAHQSPTLQAESHLPGQDDREQESVIANAQIAAMAERIQAYNAQPRKQFVAPSAQASRYAAYQDAWRTRIEDIGTRHYPDEARGRIYGSLRITVTVRSDGSLVDIVIDKPSEHAVLNQVARRIVQLASPFPPFPADLTRETDMLVITRSWNFVKDTLQTQTP